MRDRVWDLIVVGAGPAGSAAALGALQARPEAKVLLLDRADFPRDKPCGDGVAPHALEVLAGLGVTGIVEDYAPVHGLELGFPGGPMATGTMTRPAHVVPRTVLDARLVHAAVERGAELRRHRVRSVVRLADTVRVDDLAGRVVVAADGAHSAVRSAVGIAAPSRVALALRGYAPASTSAQVIAFGTARWPAYAWSFPIGDGRANVGYGELLSRGQTLTKQQLLAGLDELLPGAAEGGQDWRAHHLPLTTGRPRQPDGRVLLAGDAAGLINPLTGEGIYYAVLSGSLAGQAAVTSSDPGASLRRALRAQLGRHFRSTRLAAGLSRSPRVLRAAVRGVQADPRAFDQLVELGLGAGELTPRALRRVVSGALRAGRPQQAEGDH